MDLFRHIASRNGGIARIDADRVPGDLSPEAKEIVAMLVNKLNDSKCVSIPRRALADFYATAYGCDTTTAIKRVKDLLDNAYPGLSMVARVVWSPDGTRFLTTGRGGVRNYEIGRASCRERV